MTLQDVLDMSWAEFVLRSIGFKDKREFEMLMTREIAYQSHTMQYVFGKSKPPTKEKFWKIGEGKKVVKKNPPPAFMDAMKDYLQKKGQ